MNQNDGMLKEKTFSNKTYIVTGGGSGLGKSMTKYLLQLGANAIIVSRSEEKLKASQKELSEFCLDGNAVSYYPCDVRDSDRRD